MEPFFGIAQSSLEEQDFNSIGSEFSIKLVSNLINLRSTLQRELGRQAKNHNCSTMGSNAADAPSTKVLSNRSRLPQLKHPKFAGVHTDWASFYSMFVAVLYKDAELTSIEMFQHWLSYLSGTALEKVSSLEIKDAN